jgi:hypothetical protein
VQGGSITLTHPRSKFRAVYYKAHGQPQLILRERSKTDDYELLAEAWKAANDKARELGWIV